MSRFLIEDTSYIKYPFEPSFSRPSMDGGTDTAKHNIPSACASIVYMLTQVDDDVLVCAHLHGILEGLSLCAHHWGGRTTVNISIVPTSSIAYNVRGGGSMICKPHGTTSACATRSKVDYHTPYEFAMAHPLLTDIVYEMCTEPRVMQAILHNA
jgi:hypothetical protein